MSWFQARAENVAVIMIIVMFLSFLVQVFSRYILRDPVSWTMELCLTIWLWLVFWGGAFLLEDRNHIRFDVLYEATRGTTRRIFAFLSAVAVIAFSAVSFVPSLDYIEFMKIETSATLGLRLDFVFSIYLAFLAAALLRYTARAVRLIQGQHPDNASTSPGGGQS